jgi:hypothetical protein
MICKCCRSVTRCSSAKARRTGSVGDGQYAPVDHDSTQLASMVRAQFGGEPPGVGAGFGRKVCVSHGDPSLSGEMLQKPEARCAQISQPWLGHGTRSSSDSSIKTCLAGASIQSNYG